MRSLFYYLLFMLLVFSGVSLSLQKSTQIDCEQFKKSLACQQLEKENLINQLLN